MPGTATIAKFFAYSSIACVRREPSPSSFFAASSFFVLFMMPDRLDVPAQAFLREDEVDRRARLLGRDRAVLERDADRELAGAGLAARLASPSACTARCSRAARPCTSSLGLAPHLQPAGDVEEAGARRSRVRHHDLALVDGLGQVLPGLGLRQVQLLRLDGVEADRRAVHVHARPTPADSSGRGTAARSCRGPSAHTAAACLRCRTPPGSTPPRPTTTSACGLAFSASSLAVMTPVESRTHLMLDVRDSPC